MPSIATEPGGIAKLLALSSTVKPAAFEKVTLNVSAAGPVFWIDARNADGSWAPLTGTVKIVSGAMLSVTPGGVPVMVISTAACATRFGSVDDVAVIKIGTVPLCEPGAGVAVTFPFASMLTVQPAGASAVIE